MNTQYYQQPMQQQPQYAQAPQYAQQAPAAAPAKQSNPFWYRENLPFLMQVTNMPANEAIGVLGISLRKGTKAQLENNIMYGGHLRTAVGTFWFNVKRQKDNGSWYVSTVSTDTGQVEVATGKKRYFDHMNLNAVVKAQILRHAEACYSGQMQPQAEQNQAPQYAQAPQYNQAPQYAQTPQYNQAPQYAQAPQYNQAPQYAQAPPATQYAQAPQEPQYAQAPQPSQHAQAPQAPQESAPAQSEQEQKPKVSEDDLPV